MRREPLSKERLTKRNEEALSRQIRNGHKNLSSLFRLPNRTLDVTHEDRNVRRSKCEIAS